MSLRGIEDYSPEMMNDEAAEVRRAKRNREVSNFFLLCVTTVVIGGIVMAFLKLA